jgi:TonB-linked SusC/RagA family outer membrane protein
MKKKSLWMTNVFLALVLLIFCSAYLKADEITQQQKRITGVVLDQTSQPIIGANVVEKGTTNGTVTDVDGNFSLAVGEQSTLTISYIGYLSKDIPIGNQSNFRITLIEDSQNLEEVVVVGYGSQKKINLTGAVEMVSSDKINWKPVGQTTMALQGVVPGVTVTQSSGQPGSDGGTIRVRGIGTMGTAGKDPLILVDGIETSLNSVDPNDIESISVLKDAASSSIYGARAANGVILVTTKRSGQKKVAVHYGGYLGWQNPTNMPKQVSGLDHMLMMNEANENMGQSPTFQESYIEEYKKNAPSDLYPDTDWQKLTLTGSGLMTNHSIDITGGNDIIQLRSSFSYLKQKGIIPNTGYDRYSLRINSDIKVSDRLNFKVDILGREQLTYQPSAGIANIFYYMTGRIPANQEGLLSDGRYGQGWLGDNPISFANASGRRNNKIYQAIINLMGEWSPIDDLNISLMFAPDFSNAFLKQFTNKIDTYYGDGRLAYTNPVQNSLTQQGTNTRKNTFRALIDYSKSIKNHSFKVLGGFEQFSYKQEAFQGRRENFSMETYHILSLGSEINQQATGSASENSLLSYFGRINYDYKQKYLLEANVRYDGSSRFAEGHKFGIFPSFSAGWRISEESFLKNNKTINNLKLRASWGQLGNQSIGNYPYASLVDLTKNYILNETSVPGAALTDIGNPGVSWETTEMFNVGIDAAFFNKLFITADFYVKNTKDILLKLPIPLTVGLVAPYQNAGKVRNIGWEIGLTHINKVKDFDYSITMSLSDVHNKITDLKGTGPHIYTYTIDMEGHPIGSYYGFQSDGLFQSAEEVANHAKQFGGAVSLGDIKYINQDGDESITADKDRIIIGSSIPRYTFSLNLSAAYKGFDISMFFQGVGKANSYRDGSGVWAFQTGSSALSQHYDRWTPDNPNASYPRLTFNYPNNEQVSDYWLLNAAYLRMKNLQIGYTLPKKWLKNIFVDNLRIYASGQNIFTIDNYLDGFDVESPSGNSGFYPMVKTFTFGIDLNF